MELSYIQLDMASNLMRDKGESHIITGTKFSNRREQLIFQINYHSPGENNKIYNIFYLWHNEVWILQGEPYQVQQEQEVQFKPGLYQVKKSTWLRFHMVSANTMEELRHITSMRHGYGTFECHLFNRDASLSETDYYTIEITKD